MFCPNCAKENSIEQKFCRACGLNLEQAADSLLTQIPTEEAAQILKRKKQIERLGNIFLNSFITIGSAFVLYLVVYQFMFLRGYYLAGIAVLSLTILGILGLYFHDYSSELKLNPNFPKTNDQENKPTPKLLEEGDFQPITSVTESTTELLKVKPRRITGDL